MEYKYIDVHSHLNEEIFDKDRSSILRKCREKGILVIDCAGKPEQNRKLLELCKKYKNLRPCLGIYPVDASEISDSVFYSELGFIKENAEKIVGVGEVGLDFYWIKDESKRGLEVQRFEEIIWMANKLNLPLNVHTRDAEKEAISILLRTSHVPVILHAYGGDLNIAKIAAAQGFFFSIPPNVVYNKKRQDLVINLPVTCLLSETDCPYLGPTKERNDPTNIPLVIEKIAELKKMSIEDVQKQIIENAKKVFKL